MPNVANYNDERIARGLGEPVGPKGGGPATPPGEPPQDGDMSMFSSRLAKLEQEVHAIKGSLDWAKVAFAFLGAVTLGGFATLFTQNGNLRTEITASRTELAAEARATRSELSATTSAIANSITATRQQAPQVIMVPAPTAPAKP